MNSPVTITFATAQAVREENRHLTARSGMAALWWAMRRGVLAARESRNDLPWLSPEKTRELFDRWLRGEYAQPQWAWELMEKYDETLFAVKRARLAALNEMPWQVVVDADAVGEDAARQALAEAQKQSLLSLLDNVENLRAALRHLGMADFRGVAALEITGNEKRMRWEVIEPWLLCRPNLAGPLMYNERAEDTPARPELLDSERVILREADPIDLPAMFLLTAKHHGTQAWDAFLDTFGIPSIFLETPPNTTEEQAQEYQEKVEEIVGEGRGTIPNGAKFHTVETAQKETKSFQERADWCKDALLILATGGLLTVTAEAGSGTLAGNAHADSFERLCAASAQDISAVVDFQFCRPALQNLFPGQPILAHFELAPEKEDDRAAQAQIIATLAGAGFKPSAEVVSEMMGFEVTEAQPPNDYQSGPRDQQPYGGLAAPITNSTSVPPAQDGLSEAELSALQALATGGLSAEGLHATGSAMAAALQDAVTNSESEGNVHESGTPCRASVRDCPLEPKAEDREPWEKRQDEREHLEELLAELDRQDEASRDAETMLGSGYTEEEARRIYDEQKARDRWSSMTREGDPQTREDIEKRLAELDAHDSMADAGVPENRINQIFSSDAGVNTDAGFNHPSIGNTGNWESLGLGSASELATDRLLPTSKSDADTFRGALEKGFKINSVDGKDVTFDNAILEHWKEENKTKADEIGRLKHLTNAIRTIRAPHEVWEQENGQRAYVRAFSEPITKNGKTVEKRAYISGFVVGNDGKVRSYFYTHRTEAPDNARKGMLKYKR